MVSFVISHHSTIFSAKKGSGVKCPFNPSIRLYKGRTNALCKTLAVMAPAQPTRAPSTTGSVKHGMTMREKILAKASDRATLKPGENIWVNVDVLMTHDVCGPAPSAFSRESLAKMRRWFAKDVKF